MVKAGIGGQLKLSNNRKSASISIGNMAHCRRSIVSGGDVESTIDERLPVTFLVDFNVTRTSWLCLCSAAHLVDEEMESMSGLPRKGRREIESCTRDFSLCQ